MMSRRSQQKELVPGRGKLERKYDVVPGRVMAYVYAGAVYGIDLVSVADGTVMATLPHLGSLGCAEPGVVVHCVRHELVGVELHQPRIANLCMVASRVSDDGAGGVSISPIARWTEPAGKTINHLLHNGILYLNGLEITARHLGSNTARRVDTSVLSDEQACIAMEALPAGRVRALVSTGRESQGYFTAEIAWNDGAPRLIPFAL